VHNLGTRYNKEKKEKDSVGGRERVHFMMHYNKKERNKASMLGRKKESFNIREIKSFKKGKKERFDTRERESDGHKERERLSAKGRKHAHPWDILQYRREREHFDRGKR
jgi:hypothetical protein